MSSPSGTFDPGGARPARVPPLADGDTLVDSGEPVDDLPPLIEPVAWEAPAPGPRPPRRSFLAVAPAAAPAASAAGEIPVVVEPVAVPATAMPARELPAAPAEAPVGDNIAASELRSAPAVELSAAPPEPAGTEAGKGSAIAARVAGWCVRGRMLLAARPRWQLAVAAGGAVALGLLVVAVVFGSFGHTRHYSTAEAPSDPAARLAYFQEGAEAGDANAELQLGILYAKGEGVKQDFETAGKWFRAAASQGMARAQYDLGVLYERGRGVPLDLGEAANWYLKGAQGGHPLAQYNLAVCYIKGQGIRQDAAEGALWYRRAAVQGVVLAMVNLAIMYEKGEGVAASPIDAYAWFLAAGRRDNQTAARHAEDLFAAMTKTDQIRAQALASDVAASIHVPENGDKPTAAPAGGGP